jgi:hypothetical protein
MIARSRRTVTPSTAKTLIQRNELICCYLIDREKAKTVQACERVVVTSRHAGRNKDASQLPFRLILLRLGTAPFTSLVTSTSIPRTVLEASLLPELPFYVGGFISCLGHASNWRGGLIARGFQVGFSMRAC